MSMPNVSSLHHLPHEQTPDQQEEDSEILVSIPGRPTHDFLIDDVYASDTEPVSFHSPINLGESLDPHHDSSDSGSDSDPGSVHFSNYFYGEDQVSFVTDLFERCAEQCGAMDDQNLILDPFAETLNDLDRAFEGTYGMCSNYAEDLELGLGFGAEFHRPDVVSESGDSSGTSEVVVRAGGLTVVEIDSDSDSYSENEIVGEDFNSGDQNDEASRVDDFDLPLCWDCLRLEDQRSVNEDYEWEEVDEMMDDRDVLNMVIEGDEDISVSSEIRSEEEAADSVEDAVRSLNWEILLAVNELHRNSELEHNGNDSYLAVQDDYIYETEYETLFSQLAANDSALKGSPPAAKSVVDRLPVVTLTQDDTKENNVICAVCKDGISLGEKVTQLPCNHHYHGNCILPWLKIRNTCPVCRHELPTDDPDYERRKNLRIGGESGEPSWDSQGYNFELFP